MKLLFTLLLKCLPQTLGLKHQPFSFSDENSIYTTITVTVVMIEDG